MSRWPLQWETKNHSRLKEQRKQLGNYMAYVPYTFSVFKTILFQFCLLPLVFTVKSVFSPVIPALWEAEAGRSQGSRVWDLPGQYGENRKNEMGVVACACSPSYLGGWGRRIAWTWETEVAVSQDRATGCHLGNRVKLHLRRKIKGYFFSFWCTQLSILECLPLASCLQKSFLPCDHIFTHICFHHFSNFLIFRFNTNILKIFIFKLGFI